MAPTRILIATTTVSVVYVVATTTLHLGHDATPPEAVHVTIMAILGVAFVVSAAAVAVSRARRDREAATRLVLDEIAALHGQMAELISVVRQQVRIAGRVEQIAKRVEQITLQLASDEQDIQRAAKQIRALEGQVVAAAEAATRAHAEAREAQEKTAPILVVEATEPEPMYEAEVFQLPDAETRAAVRRVNQRLRGVASPVTRSVTDFPPGQ